MSHNYKRKQPNLSKYDAYSKKYFNFDESKPYNVSLERRNEPTSHYNPSYRNEPPRRNESSRHNEPSKYNKLSRYNEPQKPQFNKADYSMPQSPGPYEARVNIVDLSISYTNLKNLNFYLHHVNIKHEYKQDLKLQEEFKHHLMNIFSKDIVSSIFVYDGDSIMISTDKIDHTEFHYGLYTLEIFYASTMKIFDNDNLTPAFLNFLQLHINQASTSLNWFQLLKSRFFFDSENFWAKSYNCFDLWYGIKQNLLTYLDSNGKVKLGITRDVTGIIGCSKTTLLKLLKELIKGKFRDCNIFDPLRNKEESNKFIQNYSEFLNKELKGRSLYIETNHSNPPRKFKFKGIMTFTTDSSEGIFEDREGIKYTVYDYFNKIYPKSNISNFEPLINVGTSKKPIYLPLSVCNVPAQRISGLSKQQKESLIQNLVLSPPRRIQMITSGNERLKISNYGPLKLTSSNNFQTVKGEILPSPTLYYDKVVDPRGRASWNLRDVKLLKPSSKRNVLFIHLEDGYDKYIEKDFLTGMQNYRINLNTISSESAYGSQTNPFNEERLNSINNRFRNSNIELAVIFIPFIYPQEKKDLLKSITDPYYPSQCICLDTVRRNKKSIASYWANIALKVNLKLGGYNLKVNSNSGTGASFQQIIGSDLRTLVLGADITYFGNKSDAPSLVSIVGSLDDSSTIYEHFSFTQSPKTEIIETFEDAIKHIYDARYKRGIKNSPQRVIYMRDGVSESQMEQIAYHELPRIQSTLMQLAGHFKKPELLCIVAVKRHGKRFFALNSNQSPPPGFAVLNDLKHPCLWETFFLQAHTGSIGTLSSTRYFIIKNDLQLSKQKIASFVNTLCYLWPRSTSAISIPSPIMCADVAASRTRGSLRNYILKKYKFDMDDTKKDNTSIDSNNLITLSNKACDNWKMLTPMYFM